MSRKPMSDCAKCRGTGMCSSPFCTTKDKRSHPCVYCGGKGRSCSIELLKNVSDQRRSSNQ